MRTVPKFRNIFMFLTLPVAVVLLAYCAWFSKGWDGAFWWSGVMLLIYLVYIIISGDQLVLKFLTFGIIAGIVELVADWWLVDYTKTLIYPAGEPMIWRSPAYMPVAWAIVLVQIGFIGFVVHKKSNLKIATLIIGVLGCFIIPFYEYLAINAGWWNYVNTRFWGVVPAYIFVAEGLLMLTIPDLFDRTENAKWGRIFLLGAIQGAVMFLACIIAFMICK